VMARVFRAPTLTLCFLLVTVTGFAQSPSPEPAPSEKRSTLTVLLSSDAINTIVRAAGYFPLTEPQKKGTMYMLRVSYAVSAWAVPSARAFTMENLSTGGNTTQQHTSRSRNLTCA
jgi:hypothetical protein